MRVLLVTNGLRYGGAERVVEALAQDLAALGDTVEVCATTRDGPIGEALRKRGVGVTILGIRSSIDARAPLRLARAMRRFRPDVVHSHLAVSDIAVAAASLAVPRARLVTTVHNAGVELGRAKTALWHAALRRFDRVLAVSERVEQSLPSGLPVSIVRPNVLEDDVVLLSREAARARLGVPMDVPLVMAVGRLVPIKGFDVLAAAAGLMRTPGARVVLIGEGDDEQALRRSGTLTMLGPIDDAAALLSAADVVCVPSRSEGFPQVPLHAMAASRAVVATRVGGTPEVVADGETGVLVPPEDPAALARALDDLLADPARRAALGAAGKSRLAAEGFSRRSMVERTRASYASEARSEPASGAP